MAVRRAAVAFRETYRRILDYEHLWIPRAHLQGTSVPRNSGRPPVSHRV